MDKTVEKNEVARLADELTYHQYLMNKDKARCLFTELSVSDYMALRTISKIASSENSDEKAYLQDLAVKLEVSVRGVSKIVGELKDRGLVLWSHDGNGSGGTYVTVTEHGLDSMRRQGEILKDYYGRVSEKFGYDNLVALLKQIDRLELIMNEEFPKKGAAADDA